MGFVELENMGKAALEQFPVIKRSANLDSGQNICNI